MKKNILKTLSPILNLPTPTRIRFIWNFGSLLIICLINQILTGLFLAFHYKTDINLAFQRIININRNINFGWLIRSFHANGASMFFIIIYIHIRRGIYINSFNFKINKLPFWNINLSKTIHRNVVLNYIHRCNNLITDEDSQKTEIDTFIKNAVGYDYPIKFIKKYLNKTLLYTIE